MSTPTFPVAPLDLAALAEFPDIDLSAVDPATRPPLRTAFDELRSSGLRPDVLGRFSDLDRADAAEFAREWPRLPEDLRGDVVRGLAATAKERVDLTFGRALRIALDDPSAVVRQLAVAALWEDDRRDLAERFQTILEDDPSQDVRAEAAAGLARFTEAAVAGELPDSIGVGLRRQLVEVSADEREPYLVRRRALEAAGAFGEDVAVVDLIEDFYASGDQGLQGSALVAMGRSLDRRWLPTLLEELTGFDAELRYEAARACGAIGDQGALPALADAANDDDLEVRHAAIAALGRIGGRGAQRLLRELAADAEDADEALIERALEEIDAGVDPMRFGG